MDGGAVVMAPSKHAGPATSGTRAKDRRRGAVARISGSKLQELVITDSIQPTQGVLDAPNIRVISIADLMGEAISRTATEESVSSLFD